MSNTLKKRRILTIDIHHFVFCIINSAFKAKVKPFLGAKKLLLAVGFAPDEDDPTHLVLQDDANLQVLKDTKEKLEKAFAAF